MEELESQLHKSMKATRFFRLMICFLLGSYFLPQAFGEMVDLSRVASVFEYPINKLTVSDLTKESQRRHGESVLSAYKIESSDRTFAPMIFVVATKGVILSDQLEAQIIKSQEAARNDPKLNPIAQRIEFREGAYGYTGLAGVGPGGTEQQIIATLPRQNIDVQIKIVIPGEDLLKVLPETEAYHRLITEGGDRLAQRLVECAEIAITNAALMPQPSEQQTPVPSVPFVAPAAAGADKGTTTPMPPSIVQVEPSKSMPWPWIIGAILLLAVVGGILLKLRRE